MFALAARARAATFFICTQQQQHLGSNCVYTQPASPIAAADYTKSVMQRERRRAINHGRKMSLSLSMCEIISRSFGHPAISDNTRQSSRLLLLHAPIQQHRQAKQWQRTKHTRASFSTLHDAQRAMKYQQQNTGTSRRFDGVAFIFRAHAKIQLASSHEYERQFDAHLSNFEKEESWKKVWINYGLFWADICTVQETQKMELFFY